MNNVTDNDAGIHGQIQQAVFTLLTARGRSAVATLLINSKELEQDLDGLFTPFSGRPYSTDPDRDIIYGTWSGGEDLVVCPRGDGMTAEVHCHGGHAAVAVIIGTLEKRGYVRATPYQVECLTAESHWHGEIDRAMSAALTRRTAQLILQQRRLLPAKIAEVRNLIESEKTEGALAEVEKMLNRADYGNHLVIPRSVVLCGAPNAGKSSLVNSITGFQRAIVHSTPGTTRDVVTQQTAIDGWPVEFKDTAGLRDTEGEIEKEGIKLASKEISNADVVIAVLDVIRIQQAGGILESQLHLLEQVEPQVIAINKIDSCTTPVINQLMSDDRFEAPAVPVSALSGDGMKDLIAATASALVPELPAEGEAFAVTPRLNRRLGAIADFLREGKPADALKLL